MARVFFQWWTPSGNLMLHLLSWYFSQLSLKKLFSDFQKVHRKTQTSYSSFSFFVQGIKFFFFLINHCSYKRKSRFCKEKYKNITYWLKLCHVKISALSSHSYKYGRRWIKNVRHYCYPQVSCNLVKRSKSLHK